MSYYCLVEVLAGKSREVLCLTSYGLSVLKAEEDMERFNYLEGRRPVAEKAGGKAISRLDYKEKPGTDEKYH